MRYLQLTAAAAIAALTLAAPQAQAFNSPAAIESQQLVTRVADLDRPHPYRARGHWYWRERAAYTRWLHNEYKNAGHPVRHRCNCR